jgi:hypothetical protein
MISKSCVTTRGMMPRCCGERESMRVRGKGRGRKSARKKKSEKK